MHWISFAIAGGILHWLYRRGKRAAGAQTAPQQPREAGKAQGPPDPVAAALAAEDLDQLRAAADLAATPLEQHLVLSKIIALAYRQREDPSLRAVLLEYGRRYLALFPELFPTLKAELGENVHQIPVFKQMAIALGEDGDYDGAVAVCRTALDYDMDDGTRTGFEGRIARLQKKAGDTG
jgi:hypothetical protein